MELLSRYKAVRIQWHRVLFASNDLTANERVIAAYLVNVRLNWVSGQLNPGVKRIAREVGVTPRTVQRAVKHLEQKGWFDVQRGNGRGNLTHYEFALPGILKAETEKEKTDTSVTLSDRKGRQQCRERVTEATRKGRKGSRHNSITQNYKKSATRNTTSGDVVHLKADLFFVPSGSYFAIYWNDRFMRVGVQCLGKSVPEEKHQGQLGYWLPAKTPAPMDMNEWHDQFAIVRRLIDKFKGKHAVA